jgi:hypothetical protein
MCGKIAVPVSSSRLEKRLRQQPCEGRSFQPTRLDSVRDDFSAPTQTRVDWNDVGKILSGESFFPSSASPHTIKKSFSRTRREPHTRNIFPKKKESENVQLSWCAKIFIINTQPRVLAFLACTKPSNVKFITMLRHLASGIYYRCEGGSKCKS